MHRMQIADFLDVTKVCLSLFLYFSSCVYLSRSEEYIVQAVYMRLLRGIQDLFSQKEGCSSLRDGVLGNSVARDI